MRWERWFPRWPLLLPAIGSIVALTGTAKLWDGPDLSIDHGWHIGTEVEVADAIRAGHDPLGRLPQSLGAPTLRFYQPLPHVAVGLAHLASGVPIPTLHTWLLILCLAAAPWTYYAMARGIGLCAPAAGIAGLLAEASNSMASFSFATVYHLGLATQCVGATIFPLFLGAFVRLLRERSSARKAAVLFSVTALSHATLFIYQAVVGVLAMATIRFPLRRLALRLVLFGAIAFGLVAFWAIPFVASTAEYRPISDAVVRYDHLVWFSAASPLELGRLAVTGRLLDGPRGDKSPDDALVARLNTSASPPRPPFLTVLVALGLVVGLVRIRREEERFLVTGLAFGLLLYLGPDDAPLLRGNALLYLLQPFRATYLIDLFGILLAASALAWIGARTLDRVSRTPRARTFVRVGLAAVLATGAALYATVQVPLARSLADPLENERLRSAREAVEKVRRRDEEDRWLVQYRAGRATGVLKDYLLTFRAPTCRKVSGLGPQSLFTLCRGIMTRADLAPDLLALSANRFVLSDRTSGREVVKVVDAFGRPAYRRVARGRGVDVWRAETVRFLHEAPGPRVLVLARPAQWQWLVDAWLRRHARAPTSPATPVPMRIEIEDLRDRTILDHAAAVLVADPSAIGRTRSALGRWARRGGLVLAPREIPGVATHVLRRTERWESSVVARAAEAPEPPAQVLHREGWGRYVFAIGFRSETLVLLAEHHYANWAARLDGRPIPARAAGPDFVGAVVPAGRHRLAFEWHMVPLERATMAVSITTVLALLGWAAQGLVARLRSRARAG